MVNYTEITSVDQWKEVLKQSSEKPVVVFKHSTTCPVSAHAYGEFSAFEKPMDCYLVKVIEHRPVSNEISIDLGIQHESPQAFLIVNGKAKWNASHWKITKKELDKVTASL
ncbi:bacillithiol system redox-active protein YtxJ [Psychrobacillus sp. INOP01]|uniref:bacillithiol system redox-active protein YtxJ n=1 Tax=Psychrobacillus sp. INOP01 TaxID=2829187 RepID=UPI001BA6F30B|nr:bacillithiol system redox-active protein YtxJ [Psychrobacillus sp. INOP01]QUG40721.1 bacillithiol system redox-active protein YtxJ [Psychrobacillus sp. INOP01]